MYHHVHDIHWIDENKASFNEIEAGYMQGIFAYWMLGWLKTASLTEMEAGLMLDICWIDENNASITEIDAG